MGLPLGQICHKLGPDFAECISLKPLDGFIPFTFSWTYLDLQLCNVIVICPFAPYGLAHGPKTCQIRQHLGQTLQNPYLWNRWMLDGFIPFEVLGIDLRPTLWLWTVTSPWPWPLIFKVKIWKSCNSAMVCLINMEMMEWNGCESTECGTHIVTSISNFELTHDLYLEFS